MKHTLVAGGIAIAILFGGSMITLLLVTGRAGPVIPAAALAESEEPSTPAAPVAAPPARAAPPGVGVGPPRLRASAGDALAAPPPSVPRASRAIRRAVHKALHAAPIQSRLARCADPAGGFNGAAKAGTNPRPRPAVLVLELEAAGGEVRIADAQVQTWGEASEAAVSCAQGVLRGQVVPVSRDGREPPPASDQERMRMSFLLNPRTEVVASSR